MYLEGDPYRWRPEEKKSAGLVPRGRKSPAERARREVKLAERKEAAEEASKTGEQLAKELQADEDEDKKEAIKAEEAEADVKFDCGEEEEWKDCGDERKNAPAEPMTPVWLRSGAEDDRKNAEIVK